MSYIVIGSSTKLEVMENNFVNDVINRSVTEEQNKVLVSLPSEEEIYSIISS